MGVLVLKVSWEGRWRRVEKDFGTSGYPPASSPVSGPSVVRAAE